MNNPITKVNSAFDLAVKFFLISGSTFVLYYFVISMQFVYIFYAVLIYVFGFVLRKHILKVSNPSYSEFLMFLFSILVLGYFLQVTNADSGISEHLPDKVFRQSGTVFMAVILMSFFRSGKGTLGEFAVLSVFLMVILNKGVSKSLDSFFLKNKAIADFVIGFPLLYLVTVLTGVDLFIRKLKVGRTTQYTNRDF